MRSKWQCNVLLHESLTRQASFRGNGSIKHFGTGGTAI